MRFGLQLFRGDRELSSTVIGMKVEIPFSPFYLWEKVRMRAIKGFLAIENFRVPVATSMDDSSENKHSVGGFLSTPKVDSSRPPARK